MYYHINVLKKNSSQISEYDFERVEEIIDRICIPYLDNSGLKLGNISINDEDILTINIVKTDKLVSEYYMLSEASRIFESLRAIDVTSDTFFLARQKLNGIPIASLISEFINSKKVETNSPLEKKEENNSIQEERNPPPPEIRKQKHVPKPSVNIDISKTSVFIVHGRDELAKLETARFIERLGYTPVILHEQASSGKTIIEKIEAHSNVGFGIVLYTPCDKGYVNNENVTAQPRARQNVVFEHGYLIGKLGRGCVCALVKGQVELPNDMSGIVYIEMDNHMAWRLHVAKEMKAAGYDVDLNKL